MYQKQESSALKRVKPKKSLGQHFLRDRQVVDRIVAGLDAGQDDRVIEIGPGTGALTGELSRRFRDLHVFEVDSRSIAVIQEHLPQVQVHAQSILEADFQSLSDEADGRLVIVGNLPYYLTSPILFQVIDRGNFFSQAVFMIQKEVAQRLSARPRTKEYGILSVQAQVLGRPETLFTVSRHAFDPPPKVESAVISWQPGNDILPGSVADLPVPLSKFKQVVRTAFHQRRKKLANALKPILTSPLPDDFDAQRRAEELEPAEFLELAQLMQSRM